MAMKPHPSSKLTDLSHQMGELEIVGTTPAQIRLNLWRVFMFLAQSSTNIHDPEMKAFAERLDDLLKASDPNEAANRKEGAHHD